MKEAKPVIRPLEAGDGALLDALFQFYVYDFSEFEETGSNKLALNQRGRFDVRSPDVSEWMTAGRWAYLAFADGHPAGFALVNTVSPTGRKISFNMSEFFVARKYRRHGVGTKFVHDVLSRHQGRWEIGVIEPNRAAQAFWPRAVAAAPFVRNLQRHDWTGGAWPGPVWTFDNTPSRDPAEAP